LLPQTRTAAACGGDLKEDAAHDHAAFRLVGDEIELMYAKLKGRPILPLTSVIGVVTNSQNLKF
jgi:hypothetical protein